MTLCLSYGTIGKNRLFLTKKERTMQKTKISIIFAVFILLIAVVGYIQLQNQLDDNTSTSDSETEVIEEESIPEPIVSRASIAGVGDVLLHGSIYRDAQDGDTYHFDDMFTHVKPYLEQADITLANQESMIGGEELGLSTYPQFNSPYEIGDTLKRSGVDIVSIANNHTLDRGEEAIMNALNHWDKIGMPYVGAYRSEDDRATIRTIEKNGITFSFLAYTYGTNGIPVPEGKPYLVNLIDEEKIVADIREAKQHSDVIVVSLHFGNEYERMPNEQQTKLAQLIADAGAHIIFGHHPHVLQPVDFIQSEEGHETFVAYSLGNFLAAQEAKHDHYRRIGGIVQVEVEKTEFDGETTIRVHSPSFLATYIHFRNWSQYRILPMYELTDNELSNASERYEETKEHVQQFVPDLQFIEEEPNMSEHASE